MAFKSPAGEAAFMAVYDAALADWPVEYREFDLPTRFGDTHVIASGPTEGPPLVLLHAAGTTSAVWRLSVGALSPRYRVYLVDTVDEVNKSRWAAAMTSRADAAEWVGAVMDGLKLAQAHLGGISRGGWFAVNFALAAPERVKSLALLAPAASLAKFRLAFFFNFLGPALFPSRSRVYRTLRWLSVRGEAVDPYVPELLFQTVRHGKFPMDGIFPGLFADEELQRLAAPCLLLIGDQERIYDPLKALERGRRLIPHLQAELIAGAGHLALMEQPELVNDRLLRFLDRVASCEA